MKRKCLLIAHRCGPGLFPEQSIASARNAIESGADIVEMDIQYTADNIPVICHDPNTERMFGEDCLVKNMSYSHFMTLRQKKDPAYPSHSLKNVLDAGVKPLLLHCKIRGTILSNLAECIIDAGYCSECTIGVQYPEDVGIIKNKSDKIKVLSFMPVMSLLDAFLESEAEYIRLWENWVSQSLVDKIHSHGKQVWIMAGKPTPDGVGYTKAENLTLWNSMGCDGILINDVIWAKSILDKQNKLKNPS